MGSDGSASALALIMTTDADTLALAVGATESPLMQWALGAC